MFFRPKPKRPVNGNFFPAEFKSFPFQEGDLLSSQNEAGKFSVSKVLKVDQIPVKRGNSIHIQGQTFVASEDDFLLVVSCAYGEHEFDSLDAATFAAKAGTWNIKIGHVPNRPLGAAQGQTLVGHAPIGESELEGYRLWKTAFDKGKAGVF